MAITRRSFLKGVATTSAASIIGPSLLTSVSAQAAETTGTWKVSGRKGTRAESVGVGYPPNGNVERHSRHSVQPISRALPNGAPRLVEKTQIQCRNAR